MESDSCALRDTSGRIPETGESGSNLWTDRLQGLDFIYQEVVGIEESQPIIFLAK